MDTSSPHSHQKKEAPATEMLPISTSHASTTTATAAASAQLSSASNNEPSRTAPVTVAPSVGEPPMKVPPPLVVPAAAAGANNDHHPHAIVHGMPVAEHQHQQQNGAANPYVEGVPLYGPNAFPQHQHSYGHSATGGSGGEGAGNGGARSPSSSDAGGDGGSRVATKFVVQGYKDVWAAASFLGFAAVVLGIGLYNTAHIMDSDKFEDIMDADDDDDDDDGDHRSLAREVQRKVASPAEANAADNDSAWALEASNNNKNKFTVVTTAAAAGEEEASRGAMRGLDYTDEEKKRQKEAAKREKKRREEMERNEAFDMRRIVRRCAAAGVIGLLVGLALGVASLAIFYAAPGASIVGSNVAIIALFVILALVYYYARFTIFSILFLVLAAFRGYVLYKHRAQIPLSSLLMRQSVSLAARYPAATGFGFCTLFLQLTACALAFAAAFPTFRAAWAHGGDSSAASEAGGDVYGVSFGFPTLVMLVLFFAFFWFSQVGYYLGHVTFCGLGATWYFSGEASMPRNPTFHSARRALTTSFGSVCLGSLFASFARTLQSLFPSAASTEADAVNQQSGIRRYCSCVCGCGAACLRAIAEMFSHYSFVFVAMYGCDFIDGARRTGALVRASPYQPLFNNLLLTGTIGVFQAVLPIAVGVVAYFIAIDGERAAAEVRAARRDPSVDGQDYYKDLVTELFAIIIAYSAFVGSLIAMSQMLQFVDSSVATLLVCLSEEPQTIFATNSAFAEQIASFAAVESRNVPAYGGAEGQAEAGEAAAEGGAVLHPAHVSTNNDEAKGSGGPSSGYAVKSL